MFGKKENDKYSEDYIRPSEEYRAEFGHEHGNAYENHDSEQRSYDEYNADENKFSKMLMSGETILWTGETKKGASFRARGGNAVSVIFPVFWLGLSCFWTLGATLAGGPIGLFGVPFIIIGLVLLKRFLVIGEQKYAITDRRVLKYADNNFTAEMLDNIADITVFDAGNNIGYVKYTVKGNVYSNYYGRRSMTAAPQNGFFGIENPEQVCRILSDAVYAHTMQK